MVILISMFLLIKLRTQQHGLHTLHKVLGFMVLEHADAPASGSVNFSPDASALHHLATEISGLADWRQAGDQSSQAQVAAPRPVEERIDGYVGDNMEGAIDQAVFLSRLDVPVAVIGPRGTGKLYVAKVIHQESGAEPEKMVAIDCREFRSRKDALNRIARGMEMRWRRSSVSLITSRNGLVVATA